MQTLLGHLLPLIKVSKQEDIATLSLQYILSSYPKLNERFSRLIGEKLHSKIEDELLYSCQSVGNEKERPDMSGSDISGREQLLIEAKFYAGLTENQPITYLKRIGKNGGAGLVFVCPNNRSISLWGTLLEKCQDLSITNKSDYYVSVDGVNMALVSWEEIIAVLSEKATETTPDALSDIWQLKGYCDEIIRNAFTPFREADFGPDTAKLYRQIMEMIPSLRSALLADERVKADTNNLNVTPQKNGIVSYMHINDLNITIAFNADLWADETLVDTPFWLGIHDVGWNSSPQLVDKFLAIPSTRKKILDRKLFVALDIPYYCVEDDTINKLKHQIIRLVEMAGKQ